MKMKRIFAVLLALCLVLASLSAVVAGALSSPDFDSTDAVYATKIAPENISLVSAAAGANTAEGAAMLFDDTASTKYCLTGQSTGGYMQDIIFRTGSPATLTGYSFVIAGDTSSFPERNPNSWTLSASVDTVEWVVLDTVTEAGLTTSAGQEILFAVDTPAAYSYYKLSFTNLLGSTFQLADVNLFGELGQLTAADAEAKIAAIAEKEMGSDAYLGAVVSAQDTLAALSEEEQAKVSESALAALENAGKIAEVYNAIYPIRVTFNSDLAAVKAWLETDPDLAAQLPKTFTEDAQAAYQAQLKAYRDAAQEVTIFATVGDSDVQVTVTGADGVEYNYPTTDNSDYTTPWLNDAGQAEGAITATQQALRDELIYQYENGYNLGVDVFQEYGKRSNALNLSIYNTILCVQISNFEYGPCENSGVTEPWHRVRNWNMMAVPFSGMAFSETGYLCWNELNAASLPLGNSFVYDGKTYQVYWTGYKSVNDATAAEALAQGDSISIDSVSIFPGSANGSDTTANLFRYAYAAYNQAGKATGLYLGIPTGDTVQSNAMYYQGFTSDLGNAFLIASADKVTATPAYSTGDATYEATLNANKPAVITGDLADVFAQAIAEGTLETLGDLESVTEDTITFANGALTATDCVHDWVFDENDPDPTCTEEGIAHYTCSKCGETKAQPIPALGHDFVLDETRHIDPDPANDGSDTYVCSRCGEEEVVVLVHADYTALDEAIAAAEALDPTQFTADSYNDVQAALELAKAVNRHLTEDDQSVVNSATATLNRTLGYLQAPYQLGDLNQDGNLSVTDVVLLRKAILASQSATETPLGDLNQDGSLSVTDVVLLRKAILNNN